jgi:pullulanase/glycogen debranching enzyme
MVKDKRAENLGKRREKKRKGLEKETKEDKQYRMAKRIGTPWDFAENGNKVRIVAVKQCQL